jgi:hypothetical protein
MTYPFTNPPVSRVITAILAAGAAIGRNAYGQRRVRTYRNRQKAAAVDL